MRRDNNGTSVLDSPEVNIHRGDQSVRMRFEIGTPFGEVRVRETDRAVRLIVNSAEGCKASVFPTRNHKDFAAPVHFIYTGISYLNSVH